MASAVYLLCAAASVLCAVLLMTSYRRHRDRLLLWTGLGFCGLGLNSLLLVIDFLIVPQDLSDYRAATAAGAMGLLLIGLIWNGD